MLAVVPVATVLNVVAGSTRACKVTRTPGPAPWTRPLTATGVLKTVGLGLAEIETAPESRRAWAASVGLGGFWPSAPPGSAIDADQDGGPQRCNAMDS